MDRQSDFAVGQAGFARRVFWSVWVFGMLLPGAAWAQKAIPEHPLFIMNADGTNRKPLVSLEEYSSQGSPCFSPDGKKLAFDAWRPKQGEGASKAHVFVTAADGTDPKDLGDGAMPSWSPDGKQIVYTRYSSHRGVWMMNADGSNKTLIDARGWCGQWSPDGKKIAFTKYQGGANISIYDVKSKAQTLLFEYDEDTEPYRGIQWNFCWSPDSQRICFKGQRQDQQIELAIISVKGQADGFQICFQPEKPAAEDLAWHPDGKQILVSMTNTQEKNTRHLFLLDAQGKNPPKPIPHQTEEWANLNGSWTPDGKHIVFSSRKMERK